MNYRLNDNELSEHWKEQINFIKTSIKSYDDGNESEAKRIATNLRIMFHETGTSHSLIKQLNLNKKLLLWSSGVLYTPSNLLSSWTLLELIIEENGLHYNPVGMNRARTFYLSYEDWWNEVIFDDKNNVFTRKDIVTFVTNKDGGAHVDKVLGEKYAKIVKYNSLGMTFGDGNPVINNPLYSAIRQIALEVIVSQEMYNIGYSNRKKLKESTFEMRFSDKIRRFKWSTTEIEYSPETIKIVNQYAKEHRTLYIQKIKNGIEVELVLR